MTAILAIALLFTLALLFVSGLGAAAKHDEACRVIAGKNVTIRQQALTITNQRRELARLNLPGVAGAVERAHIQHLREAESAAVDSLARWEADRNLRRTD